MKTLSPEDHKFFELVRTAGFSNPFSLERLSVDQEIAGVDASTPREKTIELMLGQLQKRLHRLGDFKIGEFRETDQQALKMAVLFQGFHQFADYFDRHIVEQIAAGARPLKLAFGPEIVRTLDRYGYTEVSASRVISFYFQVRRAFHFLSKNLVGQSKSMQALRCHLWATIFTQDLALYERMLWNRLEDFSTFLVGETGSGKGAVASSLGRSGWIEYDPVNQRFAHSFTSAFVPINLSQFAESLLESELFGHARGAFTGAVDKYDGAFQQCQEHGTIFLDEIGEVSIPVQVKLLRVLQERVFTPVGSHEAFPFQGRVVAATNQPMDELRSSGQFRDDFYYRLCSDLVPIPSLRERIAENPEELPIMVEHLVARIVGEPEKEIHDRVLSAISKLPKNYPWPGNVRELEQCIRQVIIRGHYQGDRALSKTSPLRNALAEQELSAAELVQQYCVVMYERHGTYEEVGRRLGLDRRTVKKHIVDAQGDS